MLPQRLATGATGVKQARYRRGPTRERGSNSYMKPSWHVYKQKEKIQSHHMHRKKHQFRNWFAIASILSGILDSITSLMSCTVL